MWSTDFADWHRLYFSLGELRHFVRRTSSSVRVESLEERRTRTSVVRLILAHVKYILQVPPSREGLAPAELRLPVDVPRGPAGASPSRWVTLCPQSSRGWDMSDESPLRGFGKG